MNSTRRDTGIATTALDGHSACASRLNQAERANALKTAGRGRGLLIGFHREAAVLGHQAGA